jgi:hypothetical protein
MNVTVTASSGQVAAVNVSATAVDGGVTIGQTGSAATRPPASGVTTLSNLVAGSASAVVVLTWTEQAPAGLASTVVVQRAAAATGPWADLAPSVRTSTGTGAAVAAFYSDGTAVNNANYYYRVLATGSAGDLSTAGPVLGQPRNNTPPPAPLAQLTAGDGSIAVALSGSATADLKGYRAGRRLQRPVVGPDPDAPGRADRDLHGR